MEHKHRCTVTERREKFDLVCVLIVLLISAYCTYKTEEAPLIDFVDKYKQEVYSSIKANDVILDLSSNSRNKVIINKTSKVAHIMLEGDNTLFVTESGSWEYKVNQFTTKETTNLYEKYKEEYGIDKLIVYHNRWSTISIPPTTNSIESVTI